MYCYKIPTGVPKLEMKNVVLISFNWKYYEDCKGHVSSIYFQSRRQHKLNSKYLRVSYKISSLRHASIIIIFPAFSFPWLSGHSWRGLTLVVHIFGSFSDERTEVLFGKSNRQQRVRWVSHIKTCVE